MSGTNQNNSEEQRIDTYEKHTSRYLLSHNKSSGNTKNHLYSHKTKPIRLFLPSFFFSPVSEMERQEKNKGMLQWNRMA